MTESTPSWHNRIACSCTSKIFQIRFEWSACFHREFSLLFRDSKALWTSVALQRQQPESNQPLLLLYNCLRWNKSIHCSVHVLHIVLLILECQMSKMNTLKTIQNFHGRQKIFNNNKMFFKNQEHNKFWQQTQGQFLALKDVWQP